MLMLRFVNTGVPLIPASRYEQRETSCFKYQLSLTPTVSHTSHFGPYKKQVTLMPAKMAGIRVTMDERDERYHCIQMLQKLFQLIKNNVEFLRPTIRFVAQSRSKMIESSRGLRPGLVDMAENSRPWLDIIVTQRQRIVVG